MQERRQIDCASCAMRDAPFCGAHSVEVLRRLRQGTRFVAKGADLLAQGGDGNMLYVVLEGWLCLYELLGDGRRQILRFLIPGDVVGYSRARRPLSFGAQALTNVLACMVPRPGFERLVRRTPEAALHLSELMATQEAVAYEHLTSIGRRTARERVAYLLLQLFLRARERGGMVTDDKMALPLTQVHIADALGLTSVHTNRMLQNLRAEGLIDLCQRTEPTQRTLRVLNPEGLARAAGLERMPEPDTPAVLEAADQPEFPTLARFCG